jgi:dockerin type I repeat protein
VRGNYAGTAPFIGKMKECPASPGTVILNGTRVNRTTQYFTGPAGSLWSDRSGNFALGVASAIAFGSNCSTYAVGFEGGQLRLTTTDGPNLAGYKDIDSAGQVPNRPISSIVFDPTNGKRVFVAVSGFSNTVPQNAYVTDDHTATPVQWTNISVPVDAPVDALAIDPADPSRIFAGTDYGIWLSLDRGRTWGHMGSATGLPIVPVFDIIIRGGRVFAFTHGRSAFVLSNFDINNDGVVTCLDLAVVRRALNSRVGEPRYSVAADLNSDNVVDPTDMTMMAQQLQNGSNCSAN